jgi:predicted enzyme related to lactoylglutathione lyase
MPDFKFDGGLTVAYDVSDCSKSIAWYQERLGFKLQYHLEEMGWCELESHIPRVNVGLSQVEKPKVGAGPTLTWGVLDIDAARAELEAKGVRFDGETREIAGMVKLATFFDPDGNDLMLYQSLASG